MRRYLLTAILLSSLCGVAWAGKPRLVRLHNSTYRVVNLPRGANGVKKLLELSRTNRGATLVAGGSYTLGPRLSCESNTTGCTLTENLRIGGAVGERVLRFDRLGRLTGAALYLDQSGYRRHEIDIVLSPTTAGVELAVAIEKWWPQRGELYTDAKALNQRLAPILMLSSKALSTLLSQNQ